MPPILELRELQKHYADKPVVQSVSLAVEAGEFFSLLGPSGCGKSTTLRLIAGFEDLDSGVILSRGQAIQHLPVRSRDCNLVFQNYALFPHMTVLGNVAFGLEMQKKSREQVRREAFDALELVQMAAFADRFPAQLSGGQQQRVALARAIAPKPSLLLLDEPLGALDLKLRRDMQLELKQLQRRLHMTFLFVTHDQDEAMSLSDRMAIMDQGRILQIGSPEELYERPASQAVASFLGEADFFEVEVKVQAQGVYGQCVDSSLALPLLADRPWREHDKAVVPVRPELWATASTTERGPGLIQGRIEQQIYRGRDSTLLVRLQSGRLLQVQSPSETRHASGQVVELFLRRSELRALPSQVLP